MFSKKLDTAQVETKALVPNPGAASREFEVFWCNEGIGAQEEAWQVTLRQTILL